jgi:SAM-dependent methyltransferase
VDPRTPQDLATRETATFLARHLRPGAAMLEVGCGEGQVASALRERGFRVIGVEADRERAVLASRRNVPCVLAAWPAFESTPLDAIAFTRSLHHIDPLPESVAHARALLVKDGVLLVEDFAVHEASLEWFLEVIRSKTARALLDPVPDEAVTDLLGSTDPVSVWRERHEHVHPFAAVLAEVTRYFTVSVNETAPYFYRYLVYVLPATPAAAAFATRVFEEEARLIAAGDLPALGRRIVGSPRPEG